MKKFIDQFLNLGSVLFYIGIIMASVAYGSYGIIILAIMGIICSIYVQFTK